MTKIDKVYFEEDTVVIVIGKVHLSVSTREGPELSKGEGPSTNMWMFIQSAVESEALDQTLSVEVTQGLRSIIHID